jgi:SP family sugar:H+ symporter-like MFS transporter
MGYAMTWAPGIWILIGETFPTRTRAKQGALSTASNWYGFLVPCYGVPGIHSSNRLWNFLLAFFTPFIVSAIDFRYGFVFAGELCNFIIFRYVERNLTYELRRM